MLALRRDPRLVLPPGMTDPMRQIRTFTWPSPEHRAGQRAASAEALSARRVCRAACPDLSLPARFLAGYDRTRPVAVTDREGSGGRFWWPVSLPPARLPRPGQRDHRAQAAARGDPHAHAGQLGPEGEDQGGARPHRDRGAGDHHAAQHTKHDPHAASSLPARKWRRFPDGRKWPATVITGPGRARVRQPRRDAICRELRGGKT